MLWCVCGCQETTVWTWLTSSSFIGTQGLNSDHQTCTASALAAEPSCQPLGTCFLSVRGILESIHPFKAKFVQTGTVFPVTVRVSHFHSSLTLSTAVFPAANLHSPSLTDSYDLQWQTWIRSLLPNPMIPCCKPAFTVSY